MQGKARQMQAALALCALDGVAEAGSRDLAGVWEQSVLPTKGTVMGAEV